ncbi:right-handed parallel beta-helix repeat-containing protein [Neobacillus cucumis]|uniref:right-handed parallel beta-helix repeat-containing protein n=1 Tax=Neobacillus cucumis TaxID=1740721 RepID=UPI0018E038A2|nr:right-handed parallel beta-helix repeat-containing protein [Neobacillus cucumis]MBI0581195.1 right-handed parallel beta-helix repeat-containing protein [Neobacillus cucumis]
MAIINVTPATPGGINGAVTVAQPGDVILVADGIYHEQVNIPDAKDFIRIIAESRDAILDGQNTLSAAFELTDATGVEINGFTIRNYTDFGINVIGGNVTGGSNRIVGNRIENIQARFASRFGVGVEFDTDGNLALKNDGIRFGETMFAFDRNSQSNWVIQNESQNSGDDGIDLFGQNHAVIGNHFSKVTFEMIFTQIFQNAPIPMNSLVMNNKFFDSGDGLLFEGPNNVVIQNHIFDIFSHGILLVGRVLGIPSANNNFIADNLVEENAQSGIAFQSDFNIIEENTVQKNEFDGIKILTDGNDNLILRNRLEDNIPRNIVDYGTDNNFVQNEESS